MRAPQFWQHGGWQATLLAPLQQVTARLTASRVARPGWRAPVPVICVGNAGVGGSGKTPVVLSLTARLAARGIAVHLLSRGHKGSLRGVRRVHPDDMAELVGDEPLLLAQAAPTWVSADRAAASRAAVAAGAQALLLDDGLQNPTLMKTASLLVIDGAAGFGNGRLLPAGPLREPVRAAASRCAAAILIGVDTRAAAAALPPDLPVLHARLIAGPATRALAGRRVLAFAGIGRPGKFYATLRDAGVYLAETTDFADHHRYSERDLHHLFARARALDALPVTTAKDAVRLNPLVRSRVHVADVAVEWVAPVAVDAILEQALEQARGGR